MLKCGSTALMFLAAGILLFACVVYGVIVAAPEGWVCDCCPQRQVVYPGCQEDEAIWWVGNDLRGCVHMDDLCVRECVE